MQSIGRPVGAVLEGLLRNLLDAMSLGQAWLPVTPRRQSANVGMPVLPLAAQRTEILWATTTRRNHLRSEDLTWAGCASRYVRQFD